MRVTPAIQLLIGYGINFKALKYLRRFPKLLHVCGIEVRSGARIYFMKVYNQRKAAFGGFFNAFGAISYLQWLFFDHKSRLRRLLSIQTVKGQYVPISKKKKHIFF